MHITNILHLNYLATIRLNYHAGGWAAVMRMPIKVYGSLKMNVSGRIVLPPDAVRNTLIINSRHEDYTAASGRSELNIAGQWIIGGLTRIGVDTFVGVEKDATLRTGADVFLGRDTQIHCAHSVTIADSVFAGETYICDSTVHQIIADGHEMPLHGEVVIGEGTYLGFRTQLLKGCVIPPRSVVASSAVCTKDYTSHGAEKLFLAGNPARVMHTDKMAVL